VQDGHAPLHEGHVVVLHVGVEGSFRLGVGEDGLAACADAAGGGQLAFNGVEAGEPADGILLQCDEGWVGRADEVEQHEDVDALQVVTVDAVGGAKELALPLGGQVAGTIRVVRALPPLEGLLTVEEYQLQRQLVSLWNKEKDT